MQGLFEPACEARWVRFTNLVLQPFLGTVWWVVDRLWKEHLPTFRPRPPVVGRTPRHPGVGMRTVPIIRLLDPVPLLFGTSGTGGPVVVRGLTAGAGIDHPTSFGAIVRPGLFRAVDFIRFKGLEGDPPIVPNAAKPRLDATEIRSLEAFLAARGLLAPANEPNE